MRITKYILLTIRQILSIKIGLPFILENLNDVCLPKLSVSKEYFFILKVHEAISRERKARSEARNYGKVMVSNNDSKLN